MPIPIVDYLIRRRLAASHQGSNPDPTRGTSAATGPDPDRAPASPAAVVVTPGARGYLGSQFFRGGYLDYGYFGPASTTATTAGLDPARAVSGPSGPDPERSTSTEA